MDLFFRGIIQPAIVDQTPVEEMSEINQIIKQIVKALSVRTKYLEPEIRPNELIQEATSIHKPNKFILERYDYYKSRADLEKTKRATSKAINLKRKNSDEKIEEKIKKKQKKMSNEKPDHMKSENQDEVILQEHNEKPDDKKLDDDKPDDVEPENQVIVQEPKNNQDSEASTSAWRFLLPSISNSDSYLDHMLLLSL